MLVEEGAIGSTPLSYFPAPAEDMRLPPFTTFGEKMANNLGAIGIRTWVRTIERAAFMAAW